MSKEIFGASKYPPSVYGSGEAYDITQFPNGVVYEGDKPNGVTGGWRKPLNMEMRLNPAIRLTDQQAAELALYPEGSYLSFIRSKGEKKTEVLQDIAKKMLETPDLIPHYNNYLAEARKSEDPAINIQQLGHFHEQLTVALARETALQCDTLIRRPDLFTVLFDTLLESKEAAKMRPGRKTPLAEFPPQIHTISLIANILHVLHDSTTSHYGPDSRFRGGVVMTQVSYEGNRENMDAVVDYAYAVMEGALASRNSEAPLAAYKYITSQLFPGDFQPGSLQRSLFLGGQYSPNPETQAKAAQLSQVLPILADINDTTAVYEEFRQSANTDIILDGVLQDINRSYPQIKREVTQATRTRYPRWFMQQQEGADFFLDKGNAFEQRVFSRHHPFLYSFARYIREHGGSNIPVTLPNGLFRNIALADPTRNPGMAKEVLGKALATEEPGHVVESLYSVLDIMNHLDPAPREGLQAKFAFPDTVAELQYRKDATPVTVEMGNCLFALTLGPDGRIAWENGQPLGLPQSRQTAWEQAVMREYRRHRLSLQPQIDSLYGRLRKAGRAHTLDRLGHEKLTIDQAQDIELLLPVLRADLTPMTYVKLDRMEVRPSRQQLLKASRGLADKTITMVVPENCFLDDLPLESVTYRRSARYGTDVRLKIGSSVLRLVLDKNYEVSDGNGNRLNLDDDTAVWLKSIIYPPLRDLLVRPLETLTLRKNGRARKPAEDVRKREVESAIRYGVLRKQSVAAGHHRAGYTEEQRRRVLNEPFALPWIQRLDLADLNEHPERYRDHLPYTVEGPITPEMGQFTFAFPPLDQTGTSEKHLVFENEHVYDGVNSAVA